MKKGGENIIITIEATDTNMKSVITLLKDDYCHVEVVEDDNKLYVSAEGKGKDVLTKIEDGLTPNLPKREKDSEFSLEKYLDKRKQYLLEKIKQGDSQSSVCKRAQARLYEIKELKKKI